MTIETEAADHQPVEVAEQEIGDVERAGLFVGERREGFAAGEEFVAVRAGNALDLFLASTASSSPPVPQSPYATKIDA